MDITKLEEAIKALSEVDPSYADLFEELGVLVDDVADCVKSKGPQQFLKQKRDARATLKHFTRRFNNLTYKNK